MIDYYLDMRSEANKREGKEYDIVYILSGHEHTWEWEEVFEKLEDAEHYNSSSCWPAYLYQVMIDVLIPTDTVTLVDWRQNKYWLLRNFREYLNLIKNNR